MQNYISAASLRLLTVLMVLTHACGKMFRILLPWHTAYHSK